MGIVTLLCLFGGGLCIIVETARFIVFLNKRKQDKVLKELEKQGGAENENI